MFSILYPAFFCQRDDWQGPGPLCFWKQQSRFLFCVPSSAGRWAQRSPSTAQTLPLCPLLQADKDLQCSCLPLSCYFTSHLPSLSSFQFSSSQIPIHSSRAKSSTPLRAGRPCPSPAEAWFPWCCLGPSLLCWNLSLRVSSATQCPGRPQ